MMERPIFQCAFFTFGYLSAQVCKNQMTKYITESKDIIKTNVYCFSNVNNLALFGILGIHLSKYC